MTDRVELARHPLPWAGGECNDADGHPVGYLEDADGNPIDIDEPDVCAAIAAAVNERGVERSAIARLCSEWEYMAGTRIDGAGCAGALRALLEARHEPGER